jgi:FAD/FMN-containing dehydrogenase
MTVKLESWGRYPKAKQDARSLFWSTDTPAFREIPGTVLAYGLGRSYGDVCLNDGGTLLRTERMDHFLTFNPETGLLRCEAGVSLDQILSRVVPNGWFLPVTPGTKFITVAGAVANDVHGKNHHLMGTFGEHVRAFELVRSDGSRTVCTATQNTDLFRATIGGLGLTGLITWVEFQLKKVPTPFIAVENIKYRNLDEFFKLVQESEAAFEHTVAWVDCLASGTKLGRGIFMRGNSATAAQALGARASAKKQLRFPLDAPNFLLNHFSVKAFNTLFYHKQRRPLQQTISHYEPFFYPLDAILDWNRMYGRRGFFQYQFVVPPAASEAVVVGVLEKVSKSGAASFLSVMKTFGDHPPAGMMSFPRKGLTLAMDLPNLGDKLLRLLDELDSIVLKHGGMLYPAKDARMSPQSFKASFPQWEKFAAFIDPRFSSSFWRRVAGDGPFQ